MSAKLNRTGENNFEMGLIFSRFLRTFIIGRTSCPPDPVSSSHCRMVMKLDRTSAKGTQMAACLMYAKVCLSQHPPPLGIRLLRRQRTAREKPNLPAICADRLALWQLTWDRSREGVKLKFRLNRRLIADDCLALTIGRCVIVSHRASATILFRC